MTIVAEEKRLSINSSLVTICMKNVLYTYRKIGYLTWSEYQAEADDYKATGKLEFEKEITEATLRSLLDSANAEKLKNEKIKIEVF